MPNKMKIINDSPFSLLPYDDKFITLKSERMIEKENLMYSREQVFYLKADYKFPTYDGWVDFLNENFAGINNRMNHNCDIVIPTDNYDLTDLDDSKKTPTFDAINSFNYQAKDYLMDASSKFELQLPSYYYDIFQRAEYHQSLITHKKKFFENFSRNVRPGTSFRSDESVDLQSNLYFPSNFSYNLINDMKDVFPIHNEITFNTIDRLVGQNRYGMPTPDQKGLFKNILNELDIYELFIENHQALNKPISTFSLKKADDVKTFAASSVELFEMLRNFSFQMSGDNKTMLRDRDPESSFSKNLKNLILLGKLRDICKVKNRSYHDILNLKESEYEFLFYKVDKRRDDLSGRLLQRYLIPATESKIKLIDTQININREYSYEVKGYALIYGSSYTVTRISPRRVGDQFVAELVVETMPSFQLVEVPLFNRSVKTRQPAPLPPFVKFMNENNSNNKVKIYLDLSKGEEHSLYQMIMSDDSRQLDLMTQVRARSLLYHFKYMKESGEFEIFRLPEPPNLYSDFANSRLGAFTNPNGSSSIVFHDYISPNKKYYYTFRAVNGFGVYSNPTAIYEVELLKDADDSRLIVQLYDLVVPGFYSQNSLTFKDFFQIQPSTQQRVYVAEQTRLTPTSMDSISLGVANNPVWGKKFKIRIKSKATGKKMDFNVLFNLVTEKSEENFG